MNGALRYLFFALEMDALHRVLVGPSNDSLTELLLAQLSSPLDRPSKLSKAETNMTARGFDVSDGCLSVFRQRQPGSLCGSLNITRELSPHTYKQFCWGSHESSSMRSLPHQSHARLGVGDTSCNVAPDASREHVKIGHEIAQCAGIDILEIDPKHIYILICQCFLVSNRPRSDDVHEVLLKLDECDPRNCLCLSLAQKNRSEPNVDRDASRKERTDSRPSIPVDAAGVTKPPTLANSIQHAHSLIPLWIGRHFAMGRISPQEARNA